MGGVSFTFLSSIFISFEILTISYLYQINPGIKFYEMIVLSYLGVVIFSSGFFLLTPWSLKKIKYVTKKYKKTLLSDVGISIIAVSCYFWGIDLIGSGSTSIFERSGIIFSIIIGYFLLKEKIGIYDILITILMLLGFTLYQDNFEMQSKLGIFIVVLGVFLYTYIGYIIKQGNITSGSLQYAFLRQILILSIMGTAVMIYLYLNDLEFYRMSLESVLILSIASLSGGIFSRTCSIIALQKIPLHRYTIIKNSDVVFVLIGSYFILGTELGYKNVLGVLIILISIIIYAYKQKEIIGK